MNIDFKTNTHQKDFFLDDDTKFLHLSSGFGGGKTYVLCMKMLRLSKMNKNIHGGLVAPTYTDFRKDVQLEMEGILDANRIKYRYHKTEHWFKFPWSKGRLFVQSAEKKIRGPNWGFAGINESTLISHERYKEVIGRVRVKGTPYPQVVSVGTPEGTAHWKYEAFIEKPMRNSKVIYGDTRDNADNLSDDYIESLEDSYDSVMLDAYLKGLWVNMSSNRFYYAYDPKKNHDESICYDPNEITYVSMDFNVDPFCVTLWHIKPMMHNGYRALNQNGTVQKEFLAYGQIELSGGAGADTQQMCAALRARGLDGHNTVIFPDPAGRARSTKGPPDIQILKDHGFTDVRYRTAAPQFRKRQLAVNSLLDKGRIKINPDTCPGLKKDLQAVEQDIATFGKIKTNPKLTHFSDGLDYMIDVEEPLAGKKPESRMVKVR